MFFLLSLALKRHHHQHSNNTQPCKSRARTMISIRSRKHREQVHWTLIVVLAGGLLILGTQTALGAENDEKDGVDEKGFLRRGPETVGEPAEKHVWFSIDFEHQRLTHVLMPFHVKQTSRAIENMQLWLENPPCVSSEDHPLVASSGRLKETLRMAKRYGLQLHGHATLSFFIAADPVLNNVNKNLSDAFYALPQQIQQCFSGIEFHYIHLVGKDDEYPRGCRLMFEHMMNGALALKDPFYIYFMEPDCRPIRPGWLMVLDAMTRWPNPHFWAKGSLYRGSFKYVPQTKSFFYHVNGNALYNLRDWKFRQFYFDVVVPFIESTHEENPFDIEVFRVLADKSYWGLARTIYHKFQFTDVVQNMWHTEYSRTTLMLENDEVMIIHGGYPGY